MVDPKLGTKRVCEACEAKFYDLNKVPAVCPKCRSSFDPLAATTSAPVEDIVPTSENEKTDDGELEDDEDAAISLDSMADDEADDDDEDDIADFEGEEALLDDDDEDETLLDDEEDEETFLEEDDDDA